MDSIEVTGENVEQAIAKGLAELGVELSEVIVEVLEEPSRGVFGIGARPAKVRLQVFMKRPVQAEETPKPAKSGQADFFDDEQEEDELIEYDQITEYKEGETTEEDATVGKEVLASLLEKMSVQARITIRRADASKQGENAPWLLDVSGDNMSVLIGRRGETLASLQYITRLIASRRLQRRANIVVDVAGYKLRRSQRLRQLAQRMADQAVQQHRTVTLEPMPPHERRIIHLTLRNRADVYTKSVGEGDSRKVTIVPK